MTDREAPRLFSTLRCQDAERMIAWLCSNLGFAEHFVHRTEQGVQHAQLSVGSSILMLGQARQDRHGELVGDLGGRRTDAFLSRCGRRRRSRDESAGERSRDRDGASRH